MQFNQIDWWCNSRLDVSKLFWFFSTRSTPTMLTVCVCINICLARVMQKWTIERVCANGVCIWCASVDEKRRRKETYLRPALMLPDSRCTLCMYSCIQAKKKKRWCTQTLTQVRVNLCVLMEEQMLAKKCWEKVLRDWTKVQRDWFCELVSCLYVVPCHFFLFFFLSLPSLRISWWNCFCNMFKYFSWK